MNGANYHVNEVVKRYREQVVEHLSLQLPVLE